MDDLDREVRWHLYHALADTGRALDVWEVAERTGTSAEQAGHSVRRLADQRHLVLAEDDTVVMAHPFATIPLGFSVMSSSTLWWGGCAWDSFALPQLIPGAAEVLVATRCPGCARALSWVIGREAPPAGDEVAHFLVPAHRMWDDVVHTCGHQRLFCTDECVESWLARTGSTRGYVMDLATLWRLAEHWYDGRLDRDYVRREPDQAGDYFRAVGLHGPFWGL